MKKLILAILAWAPSLLWADVKVLIDAVPTGAEFAGVTPIQLPFQHAEKENPKDIEEGLNGALASILPAGARQGFSYICLLSAPGDRPIVIPISAAGAPLKLRRTDTILFALFYKGGHEPAPRMAYSSENLGGNVGKVSVTFKKITVPPGVTTAGWIYFNLPRIQAEAEKTNSGTVFISAQGQGPVTAVPIPGMKEPLMVPEEKTAFTADWYMDPAMAATPKGDILGHPIPERTSKPSSGVQK